MARPRVTIDIPQLENLAERQWTTEEIAAFFRVNRRTIERRFAAKIHESRLRGRAKLRDLQWQVAQTLDPRMLIHLGKYWLGQSGKSDAGQNTEPREITYVGEWGGIFGPD